MVIEKFNRLESAQKNHASRDQYQVHAHQFWLGVVSPVSEILLPFKNGQISLSGHGLLRKEKCRVAAIKTNTNKAV